MSTTPRVVVFDLGKVLVDFNFGIAAQKFAARSRIPAEQLQEVIETSPLLRRLESGITTNEEFHQEVCQLTGFTGGFEEFRGIFADIFWPIEPMIAWQARLRDKGVPTYIFSNTNDMAVAHIRQRFPFFGNFTGYIYSYQQGAMKPAPPIYEALERLAGCRGSDILYLDDRHENVEGGRSRGWQVILHQDPAISLREAQALGLPG